MPARDFDPCELSAQGQHLIEASAGTGKTYTITSLYLRWILGVACSRPYRVDEILIVTFTLAATDELRNRIRSRLHQASQACGSPETCEDTFIRELLERKNGQETRILLQRALCSMEEAAIYTLHSFCGRLLTDFALATGSLFNLTLTYGPEEDQLLKLVAADTYNRWINGLSGEKLITFRRAYKDPATLLARLQPLLQPTLELINSNPPEQEDEILGLIAKVKHLWLEEGLADALKHCDLPINSRLRSSERLQAFTDYCQSSAIEFIYRHGTRKAESFELFARDSIRTRKTTRLPESEFFDLMAELARRFPAYKVQQEADRLVAIRDIFIRQLQQLRDPAQVPTDAAAGLLLQKLETTAGLGDSLVARFPIAMVDEFQDTDQAQLALFSRLYARDGCLIAIGDPKQAIYGFRGADIYTYLGYRRKVASQYMLRTSYRSQRPLLDAINSIFSRDNAFLTGSDIPYYPVAAHLGRQQLLLSGEPVAALTCCFQEEELKRDENRRLLAEAAGQQTARLLRDGVIREWREEAQVWISREVRPRDLAFLVRDRREADLVRQALLKFGVSAVQISDESVFAGGTAQDLILLLRALLHPDRPGYARAACASELFHWSLEDIQESLQGKRARQLDEMFAELRQVWQQKGILPMLNLCLRDLAPGILTLPDGERRLTDLRHLGELLQKQQQQSGGEQQLYQWLLEQCEAPGKSEPEQLRLETDRNLVQLLTIHGCKGLEFNLVMIPFGNFGHFDGMPRFHAETEDGNFRARYDLGKGREALRLAEKEQLADDVRLFYVAMTRARLACHLGLGRQQSRGRSRSLSETALGYLLDLNEQSPLAQQLQDRFAGLDVRLLAATETVAEAGPSVQQTQARQLQPPARPRTGTASAVFSYTSLLRRAEADHLTGFSDESGLVGPANDQVPEPVPDVSSKLLPRGDSFGIFIHRLLELMDQDFSDGKLNELLPPLMLRHRIERSEEIMDTIRRWLGQVGRTELQPLSVSLSDLPSQQCRKEMEFHLSLPVRQAPRLDDLNRLLEEAGYTPLGGEADLRLKGLMKGVIDLTFTTEDKVYLADYKSNLLAPRSRDYTEALLQQSIVRHRYDLQMLLYSLAVHRYLSQRPDYSYADHFGGVFCLFLRGMDAVAGRGVYFHKPRPEVVRALDRLFTDEQAGWTA